MPKDTFFNLSEEKRNSILKVAIAEFYKYGYEKSSVSRIVKECGIAKGSFYQYFEDKDDLFGFVLRISGEKKLEYLNRVKADFGSENFFNLLRIIYIGSLGFLKDNAELAGITDRFLKTSSSALKEALLGQGVKKSEAFIEGLLKAAIARKEIRPDIDVTFFSRILTGISISLGDYVRDCNFDSRNLDVKEYEDLVDRSIDFIKNGILLRNFV